MNDYRTPCTENPDDWFISPDGRQYNDDDLLDDDDRIAILEEANDLGLEGDERITFIETTQDVLEEAAKKASLIRRRKAKDACYTCALRLQCLTRALDNREYHGTWGGYFEGELREINRLRDERAKKE